MKHDILLLNDQPVTCPTCGSRTDFTTRPDGVQKHTCLANNQHVFLAEEDDAKELPQPLNCPKHGWKLFGECEECRFYESPEELEANPETVFDDEEDDICDTPGCTNSLADGEGFDGYCGECADRRENQR